MRFGLRSTSTSRRLTAFTIPELLVVGGLIAILLGILLPALFSGKQTANMAKSMGRLKDIATYMQSYSSENREYIVPSQFDYTASAATYAVKVRSDTDLPIGERHVGTWTDILWTLNGFGSKQALVDQSQATNLDKYTYDSPDRAAYENDPDYESPFRSSATNTHNFTPGDGVALPFGTGAHDEGAQGYFAANNFFNTDPNAAWAATQPPQWYVTGQIKAPDRSMYIVDSVAGETINPDPAVNGPWDNPAIDGAATAVSTYLEADFRYNGACLMLFLDGHSSAEAPWLNLGDLQASRKIKVQNLTQN
jgi:type II secretory pathway pseudopilin PulG